MTRRTRPLAYIAVAIAVGSGPAMAAEDTGTINEIVVTAQKRKEDAQKIPIAITAIGAAELEAKGIRNFEGVARDTPSITIKQGSGDETSPILFMRGQGTSNFPQSINSEGSVGIYQDGFFLSRPQSAVFEIGDIERVEVLRGPQGTLYGHNTTGGAVNIVSKGPSGKPGFKGILEVGSRQYLRTFATLDLPAWNDISAKFVVSKSSIDGYTRNPGGAHDFGLKDDLGGRVQLRWDPSPQFHADYFFEASRIRSTTAYIDNPANNGAVIDVNGVDYLYTDGGHRNDVAFAPIDQPLTRTRFQGHGLTLTWDVSDQLTLRSLTGYHLLRQTGGLDGYVLPGGGRFEQNNLARQQQYSQEFQAVGSLFNRQVSYVLGLYYFKETGFGHSEIVPTLAFDTTTNAHSAAAFGQVTWTPDALAGKLDLTLGARYTHDDRKAHGIGTFSAFGFVFPLYDDPAHASFDRFNPAATLTYRWSDDISTYAKVSTGYRAGGTFFGGFPTNNTFEPESITSYELGLKSYLWDRHVRLNVSAFHNKLKNMQQAVPLDTLGDTHIFNLGRATIDGVEIEALVSPSRDLSFNVNYAYLNARIDRFPVVPGSLYDHAANPASPYSVGDDISPLFTMPNAPRHSVGTSVDYTFRHVGNGSLQAHLDYRWQDKSYPLLAGAVVAGREIAQAPAYGVLNGRLTFETEVSQGHRLSLSVWGKNILDKAYLITNGPFGPSATLSGLNVPIGATAAGFARTGTEQWGEPAAYGLSISLQY